MGAVADRREGAAGRYDVQEELARGGMGVVYRAVDRTTGQTLAFKRSLSEQASTSDLTRSMLRREYRTLITLRHPHIIEVYDFGVDELGPYYTMELLDGADLRSKCPLPWREVCSYLRDVASSLALLHSRRLLHCDVSVANIRLTSEGRAKLLDFGALASFGRNSVLAGAPPTMPPEVLAGEELDQRVDLYALGATAYYALCGHHAYPASVLGLLRAVWEQGRPPPPSSVVADIPPELDQLVLSLLELDRTSRPTSAAEVIDRLGAIAELAPDQNQHVQRSYLYSPELVGRDSERKILRERLTQALAGHGGGALIEGGPGLGKTYLLEEVTRAARLAEARVMVVDARAAPSAWSVLVREAAATPGVARGNDREHDAEALFLGLSDKAPLVLAIDDLHEADADTIAAFAIFAKSVRRRRILLLGTLNPSHPNSDRPALQLLRERLSSIRLRPFDETATHAYVAGLFGEVAAAPRLSAYLHEHAAGSPGTYAEIIRHLIEHGHIRYAEGTWILPDELPAVGPGGLELGALVNATFESQTSRWRPALRALAVCLSLNRRSFDLELCQVLAQSEPELRDKDVRELVRELVSEGILVENQGAYSFARRATQEFFYARLDDAEKKRRHGVLAQALARIVGTDPQRYFEIGFHYLLAGNEKLARHYIHQNFEATLNHTDMLVASVPDFWSLHQQQRSAGASDEDMQFIEGELILSAYYLDPTIYDRFVPRVLPLLHRTLGFAHADRLAPWIGRHLALTIGLLWAWIKSLFGKSYFFSGSLMNAHLVFVGACASASGGACFRLDRSAHARLLKLLQIAAGLGRFNPVRYLYDLFKVGANLVKGRFAEGQAGLEDQLERLPRIPNITEHGKHQYEAGLQFFVGRNQLLRLDSSTLQCAERIDALGAKHDRLLAQFLRRSYYFYRGDQAATKREEERFDEMAAQFGSRWVPDVMSVLEFVPYHLAGDVLGLKRTLHRIDRLVNDSPGLLTHREVIRAMYEGHRGRPDLALKIYAEIEAQIAPFADPAWSAARSHQAECLNALGRPAEALAICEQALSHLSGEDRKYVFAYQQLERERAQALAGLGRTEEAVKLSEALLAECEGFDNVLVRGLLHYDRARIACQMRDEGSFERHARAAKALFASSSNAALIARGRRLLEMGRAAGLLDPFPEGYAEDALLGSAYNPRAARVLDQIVQTVGARWACLYLVMYGKTLLCAQHGEIRAASLLHRSVASMVRTSRDLRDHDISSAAARLSLDSREVKVIPLVSPFEHDRRQLTGMLVLGDYDRSEAIDGLDLSRIASELFEEDGATDIV